MSFLKKALKGLRALLRRECRRGLVLGVAPAFEHEHQLLQLQPSTVLDIGANRGQFALLSRHRYPKAAILAFEPIDSAQKVFTNLFKNDPSVKLYRMALGSKVGPGILHVSKRYDSSSLLPIGNEQVRQFPGTAEVAQVEISIRRLDSVLQSAELRPPVLCKIDVQGYELEVIRGMGNLIKNIRWMIVEVSMHELYVGQPLFDEVVREMHQLGFSLQKMYGVESTPAGEVAQTNCLFVNRP